MGREDYIASTRGGYSKPEPYSQPEPWGGQQDSTQNKETGETGNKEHKLLTALNKLKAEGKGGTTQAQELERYLLGVEQKYQSEGRSLYGDVPTPDAGKDLSEWEKIWDLAGMEAADPKYEKSFEGQQMISWGKGPGTKEWIDKFGLPSIVATPKYYEGYDPNDPDYWKKDPIMTTKRTDEYGQELGGQYIYSGQGQALMEQYNQPGFDYQQAKGTYWTDRTAQESAEQGPTSWGRDGGGGGGGGGGDAGYYGDPRRGYTPEQMSGFYTPQANLQQAMVNVFSTPTVFKKRGGIVSLLRLN